MDTSDDRLLDRSVSPEISGLLGRAGGVMERCANYGSHLLLKCDATGVTPGSSPAVAPLLLGHRVIELLDAMSVLVRRGCISACSPLLRSQFEASCGLLYMGERDTLQRARQYDVHVRHARIDWHRKLDPTTEQGKQLLAEWKKDTICQSIPFRPHDSKKHVAPLEAALQKPDLAPIEAEWQRLKKEKRRPNWHSLFDGPSDIQGLARAIGRNGFYELNYRLQSTYAHASDVHRTTATNAAGKGILLPFRYPRDVIQVVTLSISESLQSYRALLAIYLTNDLRDYAHWYRTQFSDDFMRLVRTEVTDPNIQQ